jgi:hypothetical protein
MKEIGLLNNVVKTKFLRFYLNPFTRSEYEVVKKLGSYANFSDVNSTAKEPWH